MLEQQLKRDPGIMRQLGPWHHSASLIVFSAFSGLSSFGVLVDLVPRHSVRILVWGVVANVLGGAFSARRVLLMNLVFASWFSSLQLSGFSSQSVIVPWGRVLWFPKERTVASANRRDCLPAFQAAQPLFLSPAHWLWLQLPGLC